jgi:hypothetical protein
MVTFAEEDLAQWLEHEPSRQLQAPSFPAAGYRPCSVAVPRCPLSFRIVEELLLERGFVVSC